MAFESKYTKEDLKEMQSWPLERKIRVTQLRIIEWYEHFNGNVYVSFSGGKDSTVLLDLVRRIYPDVPAVYADTGLEYPELKEFVRSKDNVTIIRPKMVFTDVISQYGYPIIGKEVAEAIYYARQIHPKRRAKAERERERERGQTWAKRLELLGARPIRNGWRSWEKEQIFGGGQEDSDFKGSSLFNKQKWLPVARDLPFMVSHYCCHVMKKRPMSHYSSQTKRKAILGVMADESRVRKQAWLRNGCNAFEGRNKHSQPMAFWTEQDVLEYIRITGLEIAPVYGEVVYVDKKGNQCDGNCEGCKLKCTGAQRTGCVYCGFGFHSESKKEPTRFQLLAETHPKLYEYAIGGGQWADNPAYDPTVGKEPDEYGWVHWNPKKIWVPSKSGLGMGKVFDMCNEIYGEDFMRYK